MSNSSDDKLLDEYLSGSTPYSSRYRRIESDEVPLELDRAILDQARLSVAKRRSQFWWRVGPTLAIAATAILAVSIVTRVGVDSLVPSEKMGGEDLPKPKVDPAPVELREADRTVITAQNPNPSPAKRRDEEDTQSRLKEESASSDELQEFARNSSAKSEEKLADVAKDVRKPESYQSQKKAEQATGAVSSVPAREPQIDGANKQALDGSIASDSFRNASPSAAPPAISPSAPILTPQRKIVQENSPISLQRRAATSADRARESAYQGAAGVSTEISEVAVTASRIRQSAQDAAIALSAVDGVDRRSPTNWLKHIRQLRKDGKDEEADEEWEMLTAAYPDFLIARGDSARPKNETNKK